MSVFFYRGLLTAPLISFVNVPNFRLTGIAIEKTVSSSSSRFSQVLSNADGICYQTTESPALRLTNSIGTIYRGSFSSISTGVIYVDKGQVDITNSSFTNNTIVVPGYDYTTYSHVRHNVYATNSAQVTVSGIDSDVSDALFINAEPNSQVVGIDSPLFVPILSQIIINESSGGRTTFSLFGSNFFPCGIMFNWGLEDSIDQNSRDSIPLDIRSETNALVTIDSGLIKGNGVYLGYIVYGTSNQLQTPPVYMWVVSGGSSDDDSSSKSKANSSVIAPIIILAVVVIALIVILIAAVVLWRKNERKMRLSEETMMSPDLIVSGDVKPGGISMNSNTRENSNITGFDG